MGLMRRFSLKQTYLLKVIGRMLPKMTARERGRVPDTTKRIAFLLRPPYAHIFQLYFPFYPEPPPSRISIPTLRIYQTSHIFVTHKTPRPL